LSAVVEVVVGLELELHKQAVVVVQVVTVKEQD
jgi:hypothetical protein